MPHAYPILLDVIDAKIVIIGGGNVAARKANGLIESGARDITVVSPEITGAFAPLVRIVRQPYAPDTLIDATLVFAATDRADVNTQVVNDARARHILVNRADAEIEPIGDFITPAKLVDGGVTVTVSAGSAALAVVIRDGLREKMDPRWAAMASAMQSLRPMLRQRIDLDAGQRAELFKSLASPAALEVLAAKGLDGIKRWIETRIPPARGF